MHDSYVRCAHCVCVKSCMDAFVPECICVGDPAFRISINCNPSIRTTGSGCLPCLLTFKFYCVGNLLLHINKHSSATMLKEACRQAQFSDIHAAGNRPMFSCTRMHQFDVLHVSSAAIQLSAHRAMQMHASACLGLASSTQADQVVDLPPACCSKWQALSCRNTAADGRQSGAPTGCIAGP